MKKLLIAAVLALAFIGASATTASAAVGWPASCSTMTCVNTHLNNLDSRERQSSSTISTLRSQVTNLQTRLSCITSRSLWQNYTYDAAGQYFQFLNLNHTYVGEGGENDGPFVALFESTDASCQGTF